MASTEKRESKICPRCNREYSGYPALSRVDNKTEICSECGVAEAMEDYFKGLKDVLSLES